MQALSEIQQTPVNIRLALRVRRSNKAIGEEHREIIIRPSIALRTRSPHTNSCVRTRRANRDRIRGNAHTRLASARI